MALPMLLTAGAGIAQSVFGGIQMGKARRAIENYERQDLTNAFDNVQLSTIGSDLMTAQNNRRTADMVDVLRGGGIRGVLGGLPKVMAQSQQLDMQARDYLDQQDIRRQYSIAQDDARIRAMQERREEADLAGLGAQLNTGQQNMFSGLGSAVTGLSMMSGDGEEDNDNTTKKKDPFAGFKFREPLLRNSSIGLSNSNDNKGGLFSFLSPILSTLTSPFKSIFGGGKNS